MLEKSYPLDWKEIIFKFLFFVVVCGVSVLTGMITVILPKYAFLMTLPFIALFFILFPTIHNLPPLNKISFLFKLWLAMTILCPTFIVITISETEINPVRLLAMILVLFSLLFILRSIYFRELMLRFYKEYPQILILFLAFIGFQAIGSLTRGANTEAPYLFFRQVLEVYIPVFILLVVFSEKGKLVNIVNIALGLSSLVIIFGIVELIIQQNVYLAFLPNQLISAEDYVQNVISSKVRGEYRVQSVFSHPLVLGQFLVMTLPLYFYKIITTPSNTLKLVCVIFIFFSIFVMNSTGNRSVYAALGVELVFVIFIFLIRLYHIKKTSFWGWILAVASPFILLGVLLLTFIGKDFLLAGSANHAASTQARQEMVSRTVNIFASDPAGLLTGYGTGQAAAKVGFISPSGVLTIDSYILTVILESGILGLISYIAFFIYVFVVGMKVLKTTSVYKTLVVSLMVSILGYITVAIILSQVDILRFSFIFSFMVVMLASLSNKIAPQVQNR